MAYTYKELFLTATVFLFVCLFAFFYSFHCILFSLFHSCSYVFADLCVVFYSVFHVFYIMNLQNSKSIDVCAYVNCNNGRHKGHHLYRFPKENSPLLKEWVSIIGKYKVFVLCIYMFRICQFVILTHWCWVFFRLYLISGHHL